MSDITDQISRGDIVSFETFSSRHGRWADDPSKVAYLYHGEPGATPISEAQAVQLQGQLHGLTSEQATEVER